MIRSQSGYCIQNYKLFSLLIHLIHVTLGYSIVHIIKSTYFNLTSTAWNGEKKEEAKMAQTQSQVFKLTVSDTTSKRIY